MADYSYNQVTPELIEEFKKIVPGKVFTGDEINADYSHDEMPIYGKGAPTVLIEATTTEDISAIVKLCFENLWLLQTNTDRTVAHCRIFFFTKVKIIYLFVRTNVKGTDDHFFACHQL